MGEKMESSNGVPGSENSEQNQVRHAELPENLPQDVQGIIDRGDQLRYITAVEVLARDAQDRITQVKVRKENIYVTMALGGIGSSNNTYNATETYSVEYNGEKLTKVKREVTWDGDRAELAESEMNDEPSREYTF